MNTCSYVNAHSMLILDYSIAYTFLNIGDKKKLVFLFISSDLEVWIWNQQEMPLKIKNGIYTIFKIDLNLSIAHQANVNDLLCIFYGT